MKRIISLFLILFSSSLLATAQAPTTNKAFKNGETVRYNLKFNWGPVWANVGTAEWKVSAGTYNGQEVHKVTLRTSTNKRADKYFVLRDTMTTYVTPKLVPLFYDKRGTEGKREKRDYVKYRYSGGKCFASTFHQTADHTPKTSEYSGVTCVYDMVSMMLRARSMDPTGWTKGHREYFMMADGKCCKRQSVMYRGKKTIDIDDTNIKYRCLVFSFMEKENGKESEIIRFYISDDDNHLPVRLDMFLTFGSAKAFMTTASGIRNPETSRIVAK